MIFVVGNSRSGTTMAGRILGRSPEVHTFGELHFFEHMVDSVQVRQRPELSQRDAEALVRRLLTSSRQDFFATVEPQSYADDVQRILTSIESQDAVSLYRTTLAFETARAGAQIPCEQTPRYLFFLDEILDAIPHARVIVMIRDPRAVLVSQANKWRRRFLGATNIPRREALRAWSNYHPLLTTKLWESCSKVARRHAKDERVMEVRFEDLVASPEKLVRAMAAHTNVPFTEDMLAVPQVGSSHGKDAPETLGINPQMGSSWRSGGLSRTDIALCEWLAGDEMQARGYALEGEGKFPPGALPSMAKLAGKMSVAVPMNLSRTKNLRETLRRRFKKDLDE